MCQHGDQSMPRVSLDDVVEQKGGNAPIIHPPLKVLGWWIFRLLLGFIGLSFLALAVFAWLTYPSSAPPSVWQEARSQWFAEIEELGQLFILTPMLPLLGTVLGYVFGRAERAVDSV